MGKSEGSTPSVCLLPVSGHEDDVGRLTCFVFFYQTVSRIDNSERRSDDGRTKSKETLIYFRTPTFNLK